MGGLGIRGLRVSSPLPTSHGEKAGGPRPSQLFSSQIACQDTDEDDEEEEQVRAAAASCGTSQSNSLDRALGLGQG